MAELTLLTVAIVNELETGTKWAWLLGLARGKDKRSLSQQFIKGAAVLRAATTAGPTRYHVTCTVCACKC